MPVFCIGLNHRTAPVELRERFALTPDRLPHGLEEVRSAGCVDEVVWLSTCNRVELYVAGDLADAERVRGYLLETARVDGGSHCDSIYVLSEPDSIEHLFRVACGIDSMVLGETEILGQLKRAYEVARERGHTGSRLNRAFQRAFNVAKQVRSDTQIQRGGVSVASVAVELAEHVFETISGRRVLVIGAGDTGQKVARALISRGVEYVWISNRSGARAEALVEELGPPAQAIQDWQEVIPEVDVLVSSTSSGGFILDAHEVGRWMKRREKRPLLLVDLAVPRDIDPSVNQLPDVYLFNVDDLQAIANAHLKRREAEVARCNELIRHKAALLLGGAQGREGSPVGAQSVPA